MTVSLKHIIELRNIWSVPGIAAAVVLQTWGDYLILCVLMTVSVTGGKSCFSPK